MKESYGTFAVVIFAWQAAGLRMHSETRPQLLASLRRAGRNASAGAAPPAAVSVLSEPLNDLIYDDSNYLEERIYKGVEQEWLATSRTTTPPPGMSPVSTSNVSVTPAKEDEEVEPEMDDAMRALLGCVPGEPCPPTTTPDLIFPEKPADGPEEQPAKEEELLPDEVKALLDTTTATPRTTTTTTPVYAGLSSEVQDYIQDADNYLEEFNKYPTPTTASPEEVEVNPNGTNTTSASNVTAWAASLLGPRAALQAGRAPAGLGPQAQAMAELLQHPQGKEMAAKMLAAAQSPQAVEALMRNPRGREVVAKVMAAARSPQAVEEFMRSPRGREIVAKMMAAAQSPQAVAELTRHSRAGPAGVQAQPVAKPPQAGPALLLRQPAAATSHASQLLAALRPAAAGRPPPAGESAAEAMASTTARPRAELPVVVARPSAAAMQFSARRQEEPLAEVKAPTPTKPRAAAKPSVVVATPPAEAVQLASRRQDRSSAARPSKASDANWLDELVERSLAK